MKKVPKMISTKDAAYIKDIFNWNIIANKKIDFYLENITEENLINLLTEISNMHYGFCEKLISILEEDKND